MFQGYFASLKTTRRHLNNPSIYYFTFVTAVVDLNSIESTTAVTNLLGGILLTGSPALLKTQETIVATLEYTHRVLTDMTPQDREVAEMIFGINREKVPENQIAGRLGLRRQHEAQVIISRVKQTLTTARVTVVDLDNLRQHLAFERAASRRKKS